MTIRSQDHAPDRRTVLGIMLAAVACLTMPACNGTPQSSTHTVELLLNWRPEPQFGGFYAAELTRSYEPRDLSVKIVAGGPGIQTIDIVSAGGVPFAIVSGDEVVRARSQGAPVVALFAVYQTNPHAIMTRAERDLKGLADLFSQEGILAIDQRAPHSGFLTRKYGPGKVRLIQTPFGDLTRFRIELTYSMECFITAEPLEALHAGVKPQTFLIAESGYNPYATVLVTNEEYLRSNVTRVRAMIDAVREGWETYLEDPRTTNEYLRTLNPTMDARTFQESADAQRGLIESPETKRFGLGTMSVERWETLVRQLVDLNVIPHPIDARRTFYDVHSPVPH